MNIEIETDDICDNTLSSGHNSLDERFDFPRLNKFNQDSFDYYTAEKFNTLLQSNKYTNNSLKILHLNIRGLEAHYEDLVLFLNTLDTSFDIITLSECHLSNKNTYLNNRRFSLDGYDNFLFLVVLLMVAVLFILKKSCVLIKLLALQVQVHIVIIYMLHS